ncbi:ComEA family DNA-binding protein [Catenuloplanes atrovinosus]|uniref:Uncharacterized protein n=1 Tax=Catenuloplanes atrovinosus TaxID=137266 RepID=A0AAE4CB53_9ACTN|nr:helix-hairpin-helix domain-containing protein [Catenuloplanes atrovinosus]MDR7278321.1 hypothetical protein [Catenuloplanes atrovinosus]
MSWWQRFTTPSEPSGASGFAAGVPVPRPTPLPPPSSPAAEEQLVRPVVPPGTRPPTFVDRVDVNAATAAELAVLPGITLAGASRAVDLRDLGGPFTDVTEFATAAGVDLREHPRLLDLLACHKPQKPYRRGEPYLPDARILDV